MIKNPATDSFYHKNFIDKMNFGCTLQISNIPCLQKSTSLEFHFFPEEDNNSGGKNA